MLIPDEREGKVWAHFFSAEEIARLDSALLECRYSKEFMRSGINHLADRQRSKPLCAREMRQLLERKR